MSKEAIEIDFSRKPFPNLIKAKIFLLFILEM